MPQHILEYLINAAHNNPEATAYIYCDPKKEKKISNLELLQAVKSIAYELKNKYNPGDRLILIFLPGLEFIITLFACIYAGIIAVPVYPPDLRRKQHSLSMQRLIAIITDSSPSAILCDRSMQLILTKAKVIYYLKKIAAKIKIRPRVEDASKLHTLKLLHYKYSNSRPDIEMQYNAICYLQYTSGSTGHPKGVIIKHSNIINNTKNILGRVDSCKKTIDSAVHWLPLYHDMGLINAVFLPLVRSIPSTITSPLEFLKNPFFWLKLISKNKNVLSGGPDFSYALCTRKFKPTQGDLNLENWSVAYTGAEKIRSKTYNDFITKFSDYGFCAQSIAPCYGLAEATLYVSGNDSLVSIISANFIKSGNKFTETNDNNGIDICASGRPVTDHDLVIVDPDSKQAQSDGILGEIWLHGPSVADGYWNNPKLTQEVFSATLNNKKFLRSGDLGFMHKGYLYLYSRIKDILIFNGVSIAPEDIEWCLHDCEFIRPGGYAAFSIDANDKEQLIIAAEVRDKTTINAEMLNIIRGSIARNCGVRTYEIILLAANSIPRTSSGKVRRHLCREQFINNELSILLSTRKHG